MTKCTYRSSYSLFFSVIFPKDTKQERYLKENVNAWRAYHVDDDNVVYEAEFVVKPDYGEVGAVYVTNEHSEEKFIKEIVLEDSPHGQVLLTCQSWVGVQQKRLFFTNKVSLPYIYIYIYIYI